MLKIGIFGAGHLGKFHINNWKEIGGVEIVGFFDPNDLQAAEVESQRRSLEVLTGSAQRAGQIVKELQDLGAVTPFTSSELIDAAKRLQAFGVETNKVVETTRRLADVSGATGAELQGLVTAYGQVINPEFALPLIGHWVVYELFAEFIAMATGVGIVTLIGIRQVTRFRMLNRFAGSGMGKAYYVEATILQLFFV